VVREHYCPRCAHTLAVDVTTDAMPASAGPKLGARPSEGEATSEIITVG
jgi:hypothetical protein